MTAEVFDERVCTLGEGPLWHPEREQLFWFDIMGKRLLSQQGDDALDWSFDGHVSAAGWIDADTLLIASETGLIRFPLSGGTPEIVAALEAENARTRSNDGRADPYGGFWIGTMGKMAEPGAGAIYRYYRGELRQLFAPITISNAICFTPDGGHAYFADTALGRVWRVALDGQGWPDGAPQVFLDHGADGLNPDGAVVDREGRFWCAEWGAGRVACYDPDGTFLDALAVPVPQPSCPAFGGPDLSRLFVTTARQGLSADQRKAAPQSGMTFTAPVEATGQAEHRVIL